MACTAITKGRGLDCNRISGGVKYIYFSVYDDAITYAYDGTNPLEIDTIDFNNTNIYRNRPTKEYTGSPPAPEATSCWRGVKCGRVA